MLLLSSILLRLPGTYSKTSDLSETPFMMSSFRMDMDIGCMIVRLTSSEASSYVLPSQLRSLKDILTTVTTGVPALGAKPSTLLARIGGTQQAKALHCIAENLVCYQHSDQVWESETMLSSFRPSYNPSSADAVHNPSVVHPKEGSGHEGRD